MKKLILALSIISSVAAAKIETTQTLMPQAGQSEVTPSIYRVGGAFNFSNSNGTATVEGTQSLVKYYYGVNGNHAVGVELGYNLLTSKSLFFSSGVATEFNSKTSGMTDIIVKYKGTYDFPEASVFWGLGYSFSPEKNVTKSKFNSESEYTAATGQPAVLISAAVVVPVSDFKLGASMEYVAKQEGIEQRESTSGSVTEYKLSEGSSVQTRAFIELDKYTHLNIALAQLRTFGSKSASTTGNSTTTGSGSELLGAEISARIPVATNLEFIPQLNYYQMQNMSGFGVDKADYFFAGAAARWLF